MSPIQMVRAVLAIDSAVVALADDRISPLDHKDSYPAVVLTKVSTDPVNCFAGWAGLDGNVVQVDAQAQTFEAADQLATACRRALEAAGHIAVQSPSDTIEPFINLDGVYQVSNQFSVWST